MGSARRRLLSIAIVIAAAVAGAIVASLLVDEEERVREAAADLVAPDAVVDEKIEGRPGEYLGPLFDYRGPFRVTISGTEADDPFETRVQRNESRALDEGWSERTRKEFSNGTQITYIRNGLDLRLSIRKSSPVWTVRVEADPGAGRRAMLIGALVGAVVAGGVLVAASRSQRGSEPQEPSVRSRARVGLRSHRSEQTDRTTSYDGERRSDGLHPAAIPDPSAVNRLKLRSAG